MTKHSVVRAIEAQGAAATSHEDATEIAVAGLVLLLKTSGYRDLFEKLKAADVEAYDELLAHVGEAIDDEIAARTGDGE